MNKCFVLFGKATLHAFDFEQVNKNACHGKGSTHLVKTSFKNHLLDQFLSQKKDKNQQSRSGIF